VRTKYRSLLVAARLSRARQQAVLPHCQNNRLKWFPNRQS